MPRGTVKSFNAPKGYGFISSTSEEIPTEYFVHYSAIDAPEMRYRNLVRGQQVSFDIDTDEDPKGPRAVNVKVLPPEEERLSIELPLV